MGNRSSPPRDRVNEHLVREAALTLFAQRGYHGTALRDIAAELGIRTPSLYNHIDSKQELLRGILVTTTEQVWSDFETAVAGVTDVTERLRRAVVTYALRHALHRREALIVNRDVESLEERPGPRSWSCGGGTSGRSARSSSRAPEPGSSG